MHWELHLGEEKLDFEGTTPSVKNGKWKLFIGGRSVPKTGRMLVTQCSNAKKFPIIDREFTARDVGKGWYQFNDSRDQYVFQGRCVDDDDSLQLAELYITPVTTRRPPAQVGAYCKEAQDILAL
jgi:hypothetical protein